MITEKELKMTDEEYAAAQKAKKRKRLIRWSGAMTVVVSLAWGVYYLINGSIPLLGEDLFLPNLSAIPIEISRIWADILFAPVFVIVFKLYAKLQGYRMDKAKTEKGDEVIGIEGVFTSLLYIIISFRMGIAVGTALFIPFMVISFFLALFIYGGFITVVKTWELLGDLIDFLNCEPSRKERELLMARVNSAGAPKAPEEN